MSPSQRKVEMHDLQPSLADFKTEVLKGLKRSPKKLPAKLFYDRQGSDLFEKITTLDEYYLTRTEIDILKGHKDKIASLIGENCVLIEFGSGNSTKVRILLDYVPQLEAYMPIDISKQYLQESVDDLAKLYPDLNISAVCADYTEPFKLPRSDSNHKRVIFFPGSTIGNFEPQAAKEFLRKSSSMLRTGDGMIIGVDLKKDPDILEAAYNDAHGVTGAFNLNLLQRINVELDADFDLGKFAHHAFYNAQEGRIEMHLKSVSDQIVRVEGESFTFTENETIHTENSYKYTVPQFQEVVALNGFNAVEVWQDPKKLFSVHYLTVK